MRRATSWCETSTVPPCAVEALRSLMDDGRTCATDAGSPSSATCNDAAMEKYRWAIDGPAAASAPSAAGYALTSTAGGLDCTVYDPDRGSCSCSSTMLPACSCAAVKTPSPPPPAAAGKDDDKVVGVDVTTIGIIVGFSVFLTVSGWGRVVQAENSFRLTHGLTHGLTQGFWFQQLVTRCCIENIIWWFRSASRMVWL